MKKTLLFFLLFIVQVCLYAQEELEYRPFVEEGKVWNMYYYNDLNRYQDPTFDYHYFIEGDTLISNMNCKKLYAFNENNDGLTEYKMALYELEGKVYFIPSGSIESKILYDFQIPEGTSAVVSDPIHPEWGEIIEMQNNKNGMTKTNSISRHCLFVNRLDTSFEDYPSGWWIEGIGSELGPLNTWGFEAAGNYRFFLNCKVNGVTVFSRTDFIRTGKEEYYPEGTKWTEIRLDTLMYDSWYSKVDGEWLPNFETIEYYVKDEYIDRYDNVPLKCVYTNGPTWTDSLSLLVRERMYENKVEVNVPLFYEDNWGTLLELPCSAEIYQFEWSVGKRLWFQDISGANATCYPPCGLYNYGMIDEIGEGNFGGVRPLKYVDLNGKAPVDPEQPWLDYTDTNGGRIIQGIGVTEWNDGECLFGPVNPYRALQQFDSDGWYKYPWRNYRSMLVHFERNNEVLYDVWPKKEIPSSITVKDAQSANQGTLFDLQGRKLQGKPTRGIYIEDGKKKMTSRMQTP